MENKNPAQSFVKIAVVTALVLLIPLIGNWPWTSSDFVIMGALLFGTGLVYEFVVKKVVNTKRRTALAILLVVAFLLIVAELAVGIFGTPFAGQ